MMKERQIGIQRNDQLDPKRRSTIDDQLFNCNKCSFSIRHFIRLVSRGVDPLEANNVMHS